MTNEDLAIRCALQDLNGALWAFGDGVTRRHNNAIAHIRTGKWWWWRRWLYEVREHWRYYSFMRDCPELRTPPTPPPPLRTIDTVAGAVTIRQRIRGTLFVRWADGTEENYPVGFSVDDVEADVRRRLSDQLLPPSSAPPE